MSQRWSVESSIILKQSHKAKIMPKFCQEALWGYEFQENKMLPSERV